MGKTFLLLILILTAVTMLSVFAGYLIGPQWNMAEWFSFFLACMMVQWATLGTAGGYMIGRHKARPLLGAALGLALFVWGWLVVALVPKKRAQR